MKLKYVINGVDCPNCAAKLATLIAGEEGIESAKINFLTEKLTVETSLPEEAALEVIRKTAKSFSKSIKIDV